MPKNTKIKKGVPSDPAKKGMKIAILVKPKGGKKPC
jgi:sulfur relay (sulfurtransferase) DsrC/TusE family protein